MQQDSIFPAASNPTQTFHQGGQQRKNPFNARRQTASDPSKLERKGTSGTLNRNESQSQLTNFDEPKEVELKAQRDENSNLFQDSFQQSTYQSGSDNLLG